VRRVAAGALAVTLVAFTVAGCGHTAGASRSAVLRRGSAIFASSCAGCHTLDGKESGAVGGDLVKAHLSIAALISFTRVMPARRPLSHTGVVDVAEFVHEVAGR
jgi:mono/diheme cytochrome c family protein